MKIKIASIFNFLANPFTKMIICSDTVPLGLLRQI
jgi:hypothetical protein